MKTYTDTKEMESGYYWWLPVYLKNEPEYPEHWSIITWHPKDESRQKSGTFVGPLTPPTEI